MWELAINSRVFCLGAGYHVILIQNRELPNVRFSVTKKSVRKEFQSLLGFQRDKINLEQQNFSKRYFLTGDDETAIRHLFDEDLVNWFEMLKQDYLVEVRDRFLIMVGDGVLKISQFERLLHLSQELSLHLCANVKIKEMSKQSLSNLILKKKRSSSG